ncbi:MAG: hypothetical protein O7B32_01680 [Thaumarchaeota archaeon]|uniref:Uncharacterized protein n=1 Tax=uncultured marine microorganism HF4000_ANIW141A21 TaxID=455535 RepID=B3T5A7_9ZZZZ|nr:hypothetical protein ALOHA_HF4000ANIW141A21ctg1g51 [uncultured marine microorganism HF4000_ANIW141A21]MCZ6616009.1 hypothetical protein [Nitrososphaerota archaeon]MCZ6725663.1 hypothetical protein [Nitrososphaerota archaeon]
MSESDIKVKLKRGQWEVEITCPEDKIRQAVESVLAGLAPSAQEEPSYTRNISTTRSTTCRTLLLGLWNEGWFSTVRDLSAVDDELSRRGYHYDRTAVSHSLADLLREGILSREGMARSYLYVQKRPPD